LLISVQKRLVFLSMTKTASTSIEEALAGHFDVVMRNPPSLKHVSYTGFMRMYAPILKKKCQLPRRKYTVVCLFREPISWLESWYRYRSREQLKQGRRGRGERYTGHVTFTEFLEAYLRPEPPPFASVGEQYNFISKSNGEVGVDRVFRYDDIPSFQKFISETMNIEFTIPARNVSPAREVQVDAELIARVKQKISRSVEFYEKL